MQQREVSAVLVAVLVLPGLGSCSIRSVREPTRINMRLFSGSRHMCPGCLSARPRYTHGVDCGASLCGCNMI
eukprot:6187156-Pleurochrysis_carterae.AAC.2